MKSYSVKGLPFIMTYANLYPHFPHSLTDMGENSAHLRAVMSFVKTISLKHTLLKGLRLILPCLLHSSPDLGKARYRRHRSVLSDCDYRKLDRQCTCNVTLRRVHEIIVAVEKQYLILSYRRNLNYIYSIFVTAYFIFK